jgi:hypothetical protein
MRTLPAVLLLLAACSSRRVPEGEPANVTIYGDAPRLETWKAWVVEGVHVHASQAPNPCPMEAMSAFSKVFAERAPQAAEAFPKVAAGLCGSMMGRAYGGRDRLVLLLLNGDETLAVDVPRLAAEEVEKTHTAPVVELEGPRKASLTRGRVTLRRVSPGRYDVDFFAVLGRTQVVARAQGGAAP